MKLAYRRNLMSFFLSLQNDHVGMSRERKTTVFGAAEFTGEYRLNLKQSATRFHPRLFEGLQLCTIITVSILYERSVLPRDSIFEATAR